MRIEQQIDGREAWERDVSAFYTSPVENQHPWGIMEITGDAPHGAPHSATWSCGGPSENLVPPP